MEKLTNESFTFDAGEAEIFKDSILDDLTLYHVEISEIDSAESEFLGRTVYKNCTYKCYKTLSGARRFANKWMEKLNFIHGF